FGPFAELRFRHGLDCRLLCPEADGAVPEHDRLLLLREIRGRPLLERSREEVVELLLFLLQSRQHGLELDFESRACVDTVPITERDANQMIHEIQGFPILEGHRGQEPADIPALQDLLVKLSSFVEAHPDVAELDLNPVFAYPNGAVAVDARIVLAAPTA
ncbi:MAG: acetate--CoA ligase family protein, partial [Chloroflexi bacterium]|nr:acetate--CoA ligase family protein [Chloroflexota bacterium]